MNHIARRQNEPDFLKKLAASNHLYDQSVRIAYIQLVTAIAIAIIFPTLANAYPEARGILTISTLIYFFIQIFFLHSWETEKRTDATILQELFDTELYNLEWNSVIAGEELNEQRLAKHLSKKHKIKTQELLNWYPPAVSDVPLDIARTMCQRANVWWNGHLRQTCSLIISIIALITLATVIIANRTLPLAELAAHIVLFLPLFEILALTSISYRKSAKRMARLTELLDSYLQAYLENKNFKVDKKTSRRVQDEIFRNRASARPTPRFIYALLQAKYKKIINLSAHDFITQYAREKN